MTTTTDEVAHATVWTIGFGGRRILRCHGCGMSIARSPMLHDEDVWASQLGRFMEAHK